MRLEALLGPSWAPLGALLGPSWGPLGAILGPTWAQLGPSWAQLVLSWGRECLLEAMLGRIGTAPTSRQNQQKPQGNRCFCRCVVDLFAVAVRFWRIFLVIWGSCWGCWGLCWGSWVPGRGAESMSGPLGRLDMCFGRLPAVCLTVPGGGEVGHLGGTP